MRADEKRFIEDYAALFAPWGLPPSAGRVFGYLLLFQKPASLDQIAADLEMSKVGAWNIARHLVRFGHIRKHTEPGSKRALYTPSDNFAAPVLEQITLLTDLTKLLQDCAAKTASPEAATSLKDRAKFYRAMRSAMETTVKTWNASRARK